MNDSGIKTVKSFSDKPRMPMRWVVVLCAAAVAVVLAAAAFYYPPLQQREYAPAAADQPFAEVNTGLVDLNRASLAELTVLPGIGEKKAQAIIEYREKRGAFTRLEDLLEISGIGPKILEGLDGLVTW